MFEVTFSLPMVPVSKARGRAFTYATGRSETVTPPKAEADVLPLHVPR